MDAIQFDVSSLMIGGASPESPAFENVATRTLEGVQSASVSLVYPRLDTFSWNGAGSQDLVEAPRAELSFSYTHCSGGRNEAYIGLLSSPNATVPAIAGLNEEHNYYLVANQAHTDNVGYSGLGKTVWALGNGVVTHYDFAAAVGQPTTVNVAVQGLNLLVQASGSGQPLPAVLKQAGTPATGLYALPVARALNHDYFSAAPASILLSFDTGCAMGIVLSGQNACPVEAFSFSVDLPRHEVRDLGWAYPSDRPLAWPVTIGIQAEVTLNGLQLDALNRHGCPDRGYAFTAAFKTACGGLDDYSLTFDGAKLESQNLSLSVGGGAAKASLSWSIHLNDINRVGAGVPGFYITSPGLAYTSLIFPQVEYAPGLAPLTFNLSEACYLAVVSGPGFLIGNSCYVTDVTSTVVVRAFGADGTDVEDITVTVT